MIWRPDNWKNPIGDFIPNIGKGQQWAFEQGADAMLKALKKDAIHINKPEGWKYLEVSYNDWIHGNKIGYIVFIPEEIKKREDSEVSTSADGS